MIIKKIVISILFVLVNYLMTFSQKIDIKKVTAKNFIIEQKKVYIDNENYVEPLCVWQNGYADIKNYKFCLLSEKSVKLTTFNFSVDFACISEDNEIMFAINVDTLIVISKPTVLKSTYKKLEIKESVDEIEGIFFINKSSFALLNNKKNEQNETEAELLIFAISDNKVKLVKKLPRFEYYSTTAFFSIYNNKFAYNNGKSIEIYNSTDWSLINKISPKKSEDYYEQYKYYNKEEDTTTNIDDFPIYFINDNVLAIVTPYELNVNFYNVKNGIKLNEQLLLNYATYGTDLVYIQPVGEYIIINRGAGDIAMLPSDNILTISKFSKTENKLIDLFTCSYTESYGEYRYSDKNSECGLETTCTNIIKKVSNTSFSISTGIEEGKPTKYAIFRIIEKKP